MTGRVKEGSLSYPMLVANTKHSLDVMGIEFTEPKTIKKGTVLGYGVIGQTEDDVPEDIYGWDVLGAKNGLKARAIAAEDVASATAIIAYRSGGFVTQALIVDEDYTMTEADVQSLQDAGIYIENMME